MSNPPPPAPPPNGDRPYGPPTNQQMQQGPGNGQGLMPDPSLETLNRQLENLQVAVQEMPGNVPIHPNPVETAFVNSVVPNSPQFVQDFIQQGLNDYCSRADSFYQAAMNSMYPPLAPNYRPINQNHAVQQAPQNQFHHGHQNPAHAPNYRPMPQNRALQQAPQHQYHHGHQNPAPQNHYAPNYQPPQRVAYHQPPVQRPPQQPMAQSSMGHAQFPVPHGAPVNQRAPIAHNQYPMHPGNFPLPPQHPPRYVNHAPPHHHHPFPHQPQNFRPPHHHPAHPPPYMPGPPQFEQYQFAQNLVMIPRDHPHQPAPSSSSSNPGIRFVPYEFVPASNKKLELAKMTKEEAWTELNKVALNEDQLAKNGFAVYVKNGKELFLSDCNVLPAFKMPTVRCIRCKGLFVSKGPCRFHEDWSGKFNCCGKRDNGCQEFPEHVHSKMSRKELKNFVPTPASSGEGDHRDHNVFALDAEMVYTTNGFEAARVTIVDQSAATVLDIHIKPSGRVVDYNTQFSGLRAGDLDEGVSLQEARAKLMTEINQNTILVGHHLASDLKALKMVHGKVVDTAVLFTVHDKFPSLKKLASEHLKKIIHEDENGHDPVEDAITSLEIVQEKWGQILEAVTRRRPGTL